ncbi:MAG: exodeoxyribonuclease VII large subunit [Clostridia bacterium]|nr:exodeoxyribonuclease VII large subunit [Clostridia bacterium]
MSWTLTVTDLNEYVRRSLAGDPMLQDVILRGEISNFKWHVSGHLYFSLKDEQSRIQCVMFRQHAERLRFTPADGMRVELRGSVSLYTAAGSYQFYAQGMTRDGLGELYIRFEELKKRLLAEGLFDVSLKKPLPVLPRMVGVVTSGTGAVIHDIARVAGRRNPGVQLVLRAAKVQGEGAAEDVAAGIAELSRVPGVDVIIIGRGGGSLEDLWAFNEETLVRAIVACPVPVISAVGHETDVTLADFAADVRAATPSAAAELAVQQRDALLSLLGELEARLFRAGLDQWTAGQQRVMALEKRLALVHPLTRARDCAARRTLLETRLTACAEAAISDRRARLLALSDKLSALGPRGALARGYLVALNDRGEAAASLDEVTEEMTLLLRDGRARVRTLSRERGEPFGGEAEIV